MSSRARSTARGTISGTVSVYLEDDGRFSLVIKKVKAKDQGTYECQISTKPTKSLIFNLNIRSK